VDGGWVDPNPNTLDDVVVVPNKGLVSWLFVAGVVVGVAATLVLDVEKEDPSVLDNPSLPGDCSRGDVACAVLLDPNNSPLLRGGSSVLCGDDKDTTLGRGAFFHLARRSWNQVSESFVVVVVVAGESASFDIVSRSCTV
jgi:hypothetical protein